MKEFRHLPLLAILLLAALIRLWISDFTLILLDYDAFYHARIAEIIYQTHHIPTWDASELGGIPHYYPPVYHILIAIGKQILPGRGTITIGSALTVFFGVLSTLFVYLIGRRFSENIALVSSLLYALTPMMALRSGLWARPTGMSMMLTLILVYLFIRTSKTKDPRFAALALIASTAYIFTHSFVLIVLFMILGASLVTWDNATTKTFLRISLASLLAGALYYYRFLPHLNFSISKSGEYMPLLAPLGTLYPSGNSEALFAAILFLGLFNLAFFPLVLHGIYEMTKREKLLGIIAIFSLLLIFLGANMFMLFNFMVPLSIAVSISRVAKIGRPSTAAVILLIVIVMNASGLLMTKGEQKHPHLDITREILSGAPLSYGNLVLASDTNVGHAIPYYSPASTFISDLTDTKKYNRNREVYDMLNDANVDTGLAMDLLSQNEIDHLLVIGDTAFPFTKDEENFEHIKKANKNDVNATLYRVKK